MATIYTSDSLRNIFQSSFNLTQWYSFSQHFFNASELREKPERIIENTSDEGYYLGNINTTDSYRIGLFHYNIRQGSVANKRVGHAKRIPELPRRGRAAARGPAGRHRGGRGEHGARRAVHRGFPLGAGGCSAGDGHRPVHRRRHSHGLHPPREGSAAALRSLQV